METAAMSSEHAAESTSTGAVTSSPEDSSTGTASSSSSDEGADDTVGEVPLDAGTYSLVQYALDGGSLVAINETARRDAFLVHVDAEAGVLQTAMCAQSALDTPASSPCRLDPQNTEWYCQCYGYAVSGDTLALAVFEPGAEPPSVEVGTGLPEADLDPAPGGVSLTAWPPGIWGSDGTLSTYVLEAVADTVFDEVHNDPLRPPCSPC